MPLDRAPLGIILNRNLEILEAHSEELSLCSIMMVNPEGTHLVLGAARNLPDTYFADIGPVPIGANFGSCGVAVATGTNVITEDVLTHPDWSGFRQITRKYGLRACWSVPIYSSSLLPLGVMAIYNRKPYLPGKKEIEWVEALAKLTSLEIERAGAAERLKESEALLRIACAAGSLGGWTVEFPEYRITFSDQVCDIHEIPRGTSLSFEEALAFYPAEWRDRVVESFETCRTEGKSFDEEVEIITARGRRIWVRVIGEGIRNEEGAINRVQAALQAIGHVKDAENERRQLATRLGTTLESITDPLYIVDRNWRFTFVNLPAARSLNRDRDELLTKSLWEVCPNLEDGSIGQDYRRAMAENRAVNRVEYCATHGRWYDVRAYPSAEGLAVCYHDITERLRDQKQLRLLKQCVSKISDLVMITEAAPLDEPGPRIVFVNEAFVRTTGYSKEEVMGKSPRFLQGEKTQNDQLKVIRKALESGLSSRSEIINYKKSGEEFWVELDITPVFAPDGGGTHFVAIERVISARKAQECITREAEQRHLMQRNALITLSNAIQVDDLTILDAFRQITEITSRTLNVARVGIWKWSEDNGRIECVELCELASGEHTAGMSLSTSDYPSYFKALDEMQVVAVDDAMLDPLTRDFAKDYLTPRGITSMMDVQIHYGGTVKYFVCHEHIGAMRRWKSDEKTFAIAIANLVKLALEIQERLKIQHALKVSEQRFHAVAAATNDTIWEWDLDSDRFWWKGGLSNLFLWPAEENDVAGYVRIRQIHPEDRDRVVQGLHSHIRDGCSHWSSEYRFVRNDGSIANVLDRGQVIRDSAGTPRTMVGGIIDLTAQKKAEQELARSHRALRMLSSCSEARLRVSDENLLLAEFCRIGVEVGGYRMAWVGYATENEKKAVMPMAHAGVEEGYLSSFEFSWDESQPHGKSPEGIAIRNGEPIIIEDLLQKNRFGPWAGSAKENGYRSLVVLPLRSGQQTFGLLALYGNVPNLAEGEELELLKVMADELAFGIENIHGRLELHKTEQTILKVAQSVSGSAGAEFFGEFLIQGLTEILGAAGGLIGRLLPGGDTIETISMSFHGKSTKSFRYGVAGTPCGEIIKGGFFVIDHGIQQRFPNIQDYRDFGINACAGIPLFRQDQSIVGVLIVFFSGSLGETELVKSTLTIFAARVAAELERKDADIRILEQASLLDKTTDAIYLLDLSHKVTYWNKGAERIYGWTPQQAVGRTVEELIHRDMSDFKLAHGETLHLGEWMGDLRQVDKEGRELVIESRWSLVKDENGLIEGVLIINSDVSEHRRLEQQFLRVQRLQSIGTVAGGVAHDLTNILSPISMAVELLRLQVVDRGTSDLINVIGNSAKRGTDMVGQILSFTRGVNDTREEVNIEKIIRELVNTLRDTLLKGIEIKVRISPDLWRIQGDSTQVHQVLLNLCVNARDAISGSGVITIHAENAEIGGIPEVGPGLARYIRIVVVDNGEGMSAEIMDKIFDPFFTTKPVGRGTGLGLSSSLAIVRNHGGFMRPASEPGKGSKISVYLPTKSVSVSSSLGSTAFKRFLGHGETVLIVDDETSIRQITEQTLTAFGYKTLLAADGAEALSIYQDSGHEIQVILTDMVMPILNGEEMIRRIVEGNPSVRIIASSGSESHEDIARQAGAGWFLMKPYPPEVLMGCLNEVLNKTPEFL